MVQEDLLQGEQGGQRKTRRVPKTIQESGYFERGWFGKDGDRQSDNVCRVEVFNFRHELLFPIF